MSKAAERIIAGLLLFGLTPLLLYVALVDRSPERDVSVLATYEVRGEQLVLAEGEQQDWHAAAWERFTQLVPAEYRRNVTSFEAIVGEADGQVYPNDTELTTWTLALARNSDPRILDATVIHELAHLLTLRPGELRPATGPQVEDHCATYFTGEGCVLRGSLLDGFIRRFWDEEALAGLETVSATDRFQAEPRHFVTDYAATNPGEDIAETFVDFVYRPRDIPETVAEEKIAYLWQRPELVELREVIRQNL